MNVRLSPIFCFYLPFTPCNGSNNQTLFRLVKTRAKKLLRISNRLSETVTVKTSGLLPVGGSVAAIKIATSCSILLLSAIYAAPSLGDGSVGTYHCIDRYPILCGYTMIEACITATNNIASTVPGTASVSENKLWCNWSFYADYPPASGRIDTARALISTHYSCGESQIFDAETQSCEQYLPEELGNPGCGGDGGNGVGNPINIAAGNKYQREVDVSIKTPVGAGMEFVRSYNSRATASGELGAKWTHSYAMNIQFVDKTYANGAFSSLSIADVKLADGKIIRFRKDSSGWHAGPDQVEKLSTVTDPITGRIAQSIFTTRDQQIITFSATGKALQIQDRVGSVTTALYDQTDRLERIETDTGHYLAFAYDTSNRIKSVTDDGNRVWQYRYDSKNNLVYADFPDATTRQYHYQNSSFPNALTGITDERGIRYATYHYDTLGRATTSYHADDVDRVDIAFNANLARTVTNALGKKTIYRMTNIHGARKTTQVEGVASARCLADVQSRTYYPSNGWLETSYDKAGVATYYQYYTDEDRYGLLMKRIEAKDTPAQRTFTFDWDSTTRRVTQEILEGQLKTDYTYHPNSRLHTKTETDLTNGNTRTWAITYTYHDPGADTRIRTMSLHGPLSIEGTTVHEYSTQGYLTKVTNAAGHVMEYQDHNAQGQPGKIIDPNDKVTLLTYTVRGWLDTITRDAGGMNALTLLEYDAVGQLTGATLADATHLDFEYDDARRLISIQNQLGERIEYTLDNEGNPELISLNDTAGGLSQSMNYQFDELSRLFKALGSNGQETQYSFDEKGQLNWISDSLNPSTLLEFDALNRLRLVTDPNNNSVALAYDSVDRIVEVTDQRNLATEYRYDGFGNLIRVASPDTGVTTYTYDEAGNRLSQTDARNVVTHYTYDVLNRLVSVTYPAEPAKNVSYIYDNVGYCTSCKGHLSAVSDSSGLTSYFHNALGHVFLRISDVKIPAGGTVRLITGFSHNSAGRLTAMQYPNGQIVKYHLDSAGQVNQVTRQNNATTHPVAVASAIRYTPFGQPIEVRFGNDLQLSRSYDLDGRLETQLLTGQQNLLYAYDVLDNVREITNQIDLTRSEAYTYDPLNRLQSAAGKYGSIAYEYDEVGNRKARTIERNGHVTAETYRYPLTSNRLDQIDTLIGANPTVERQFFYDGGGNLIEETDTDGTHVKHHYDSTNRRDSVTP